MGQIQIEKEMQRYLECMLALEENTIENGNLLKQKHAQHLTASAGKQSIRQSKICKY